ncbi:MAG: HEAT repeat domain-containing protein, partial [Candidatus Omnitrophota bacterium]
MSKYKLLIKTISLLVASVFLFQQIVWAQGDMPEIVSGPESTQNVKGINDLFNNKVLSNKAVINEIYDPKAEEIPRDKEVVINIQDNHASLTAQYSIVGLLKELLQEYEINMIAIEGGAGYIDTSILKSFPDKKIREKTADFLMKQGKLSAGEFFTATTDNDIALYGVENNDLYQKNLKLFRNIYIRNRKHIKILDRYLKELEQVEDRTYSKSLRQMVYRSRLHRGGKISFDVYREFLMDFVKDRGLFEQKYPDLTKLVNSIQLEKDIDFAKANVEREELVRKLSGIAVREDMELMVISSMSFQKGNITEGDYHKWLMDFALEKGLNIQMYPELRKVVDYQKSYAEINIAFLDRELRTLEEEVIEQLFSGDNERELYARVKTVFLLTYLLKIRATGEDVEYLRANIAKIKTDRPETRAVLQSARQALRFYDVAEQRNKVMLSNTVKAMRREGRRAAALISGGYHTTGLTQLMKDKGLSYLVLAPSCPEDVSRPYVAVLTKKTGPYTRLVTKGAYHLAMSAYFDGGNLDELEEMSAFAAGQAVLEKKELSGEIDKWLYRFKKFSENTPRHRRQAARDKMTGLRDLAEKIRNIKAVEIQGKNECVITIGNNTYRVDAESAILEKSGRKSGTGKGDFKNKLPGVLKMFLKKTGSAVYKNFAPLFRIRIPAPRKLRIEKLDAALLFCLLGILTFAPAVVAQEKTETERVKKENVTGVEKEKEAKVEKLIRRLREGNGGDRGIAAVVLGDLGSEKAVEPLVKALGDKDPRTRYRVAEALGKLGNEKAVEPLVKALGDKHPSVRSAVVQALGELGSKKAVEPLINVLEDPYDFVREEAVRALMRTGKKHPVNFFLKTMRDCDVYLIHGKKSALLIELKKTLDWLWTRTPVDMETVLRVERVIKALDEKALMEWKQARFKQKVWPVFKQRFTWILKITGIIALLSILLSLVSKIRALRKYGQSVKTLLPVLFILSLFAFGSPIMAQDKE